MTTKVLKVKLTDKGQSVSEIVLINVSGQDKPGLTSEITEIMAQYQIRILDIGQAVIHDHLTWGILIELPEEQSSSPLLKDLLFKMHELGLPVRFEPVSKEEYENMYLEDIDPSFTRETAKECMKDIKYSPNWRIESTHRTKVGTILPVEVSGHSFFYNGQEYICAFARDITQRLENRKIIALEKNFNIDFDFMIDYKLFKILTIFIFYFEFSFVSSTISLASKIHSSRPQAYLLKGVPTHI